jgi:hypothetical protein
LARLQRLLANIDIGYEDFQFLNTRREVTDGLRAIAVGFFRIYFVVMLDSLILQLGKLHKSSQSRAVTLDSALRGLELAGFGGIEHPIRGGGVGGRVRRDKSEGVQWFFWPLLIRNDPRRGCRFSAGLRDISGRKRERG